MKRPNMKDELDPRPKEEAKPKTYIEPKARKGKVMLNVLIDPLARDHFKSAASENGTTVQALIRGFINQYLEENKRKPIA